MSICRTMRLNVLSILGPGIAVLVCSSGPMRSRASQNTEHGLPVRGVLVHAAVKHDLSPPEKVRRTPAAYANGAGGWLFIIES